MKEFEQALKRARSSVGTPANRKAPPEPMKEAPKIIGTAQDTESFARPASTSAPAEQSSGLATMNLPVLQADHAQFRKNFGADTQDGRNVDGAFRILRTHVLDTMKDRGGKILGVTSPTPGAGKSVTSIHLAQACARRAETQVVLADFDFRRPSVAPYMDAKNFPPSIGYFRGEGDIEQYLSRNESGNLLYMLTDRSTEMSAEYLAGSRMDEALDFFTDKEGDVIVIVDLPPLVGCDDTLAIMPKLDGLLVVVAAGENKFGDVEQALSQVPKEKIITTVLNKAETATASYDYY